MTLSPSLLKFMNPFHISLIWSKLESRHAVNNSVFRQQWAALLCCCYESDVETCKPKRIFVHGRTEVIKADELLLHTHGGNRCVSCSAQVAGLVCLGILETGTMVAAMKHEITSRWRERERESLLQWLLIGLHVLSGLALERLGERCSAALQVFIHSYIWL